MRLQAGTAVGKHLTLLPSGRKHAGRAGKTSMGNQVVRGSGFEKEDKENLSDSEEGVTDVKTPVTDKLGKKRTSAGIVAGVGGELQNTLENFGADIKDTLLAKKKGLTLHAQASLQSSNQKIEHIWKTQQDLRQKLNQEFSQQFLTLFQQWETDVQKAEEQEGKLANLF